MKGQTLITAIAMFLLTFGTAVTGGSAAEQSDPKAGKKKYDLLCTTCHGETGKGDGPAAAALPVKPQNHTDGKHMNSLKDKYLFDIIKGGGASMGKSPLMPPWGGQLKEQDIRNVIAYIRSLAVPPYRPRK